MTLTAYGEHAQEAVDKAAERVEALDALLSTGNENSEIYQLNQNGEATLSEEGWIPGGAGTGAVQKDRGCF